AVLAGREDVVTPEGCAVAVGGFGFGRGRCRGKGADGGCRHRECHTRSSGAHSSSEGRGHVLSPPGGAGDGSAACYARVHKSRKSFMFYVQYSEEPCLA